MANILSTNPWNIDTPGAGILKSGALKLKHIEFYGYAAATDKVIIQNRFGTVIAQLSGTTDLQEVRTGAIGWVDGLIVPTITSGKCLIFYD